MDRRLFLAAAASAVALPGLTRAQDGPPDLQTELERIRAEAAIPALGGAIVTAEGLTFLGVSGVRRTGFPEPATVADKWHLGSNTKAMTAAVYARLVEQGRARWGAPLPELFPDLAVDPAFAEVTVDQLFQHRARVADQAVMPGWMLLAWAGGDVRALRARMAETVLTAPPSGEVGRFAYGNANYILAGAAIERITGQAWEDVIRLELFEPLGLASAGFGAPQGAQPWGHRPGAAGLVAMDPAVIGSDNPPALGPAGTVHMTLEDYARFVRLFLTDGGGFLTPDSVARLTRPAADDSGSYALGWGVRPAQPWTGGASSLSHDGSNTMWYARAAVAPARRAAAICVANVGPAGRDGVDALTRALIERFPA